LISLVSLAPRVLQIMCKEVCYTRMESKRTEDFTLPHTLLWNLVESSGLQWTPADSNPGLCQCDMGQICVSSPPESAGIYWSPLTPLEFHQTESGGLQWTQSSRSRLQWIPATPAESTKFQRTLADSSRLHQILPDSTRLQQSPPDSTRLQRTLADSSRVHQILPDSTRLQQALTIIT
jgi:hypothetical protein